MPTGRFLFIELSSAISLYRIVREGHTPAARFSRHNAYILKCPTGFSYHAAPLTWWFPGGEITGFFYT